MFRNAYQRGFLTVFYSVGSKPLEIWEVHMENGHISRLLDPDLKSMVLDIRGYNVSTAYIQCPTKNRILGITMPFMIMIVKNLKKYFTFEVTIMDDSGARRRFRVSNFQSTTQILPMSTAMPIGLADGWNQIQFNLSEFTRRAYNKTFIEVQKIKVNANIRLRRIYFAEKLTAEEDLPAEYRIFLPLPSKGKGKKAPVDGSKTNVIKEPSKAMIKTVSRASMLQVPPPVPEDVPGEGGVPEAAPQVEAGPTADVETPTTEPQVEAGPTADVETPTTEPEVEAGPTADVETPNTEPQDEAGPTADVETPTTEPPEEVALVGEAPSEKGDVEGETIPGKGDVEGETDPGKGEGEGEATPVGDAEAKVEPVAEEAAQQPAD